MELIKIILLSIGLSLLYCGHKSIEPQQCEETIVEIEIQK